MGMAASQARFLCLTARKANCEYKSTALAQQKLEITNQISNISNEYAQALNATKLIWQNDAVSGAYGLTYSLLMTPSAMNDFNAYMVTSPSGAIVLNGEYAAAARAAGISKAGGIGSQQGRDKFISALVSQGVVTDETSKSITKYDYQYDSVNNEFASLDVQDKKGIAWNSVSGLGGNPLVKNGGRMLTLSDLIQSEAVGERVVDWAKMFVADGELTKIEYEYEKENLMKIKRDLMFGNITDDVINHLKKDKENYDNNNVKYPESYYEIDADGEKWVNSDKARDYGMAYEYALNYYDNDYRTQKNITQEQMLAIMQEAIAMDLEVFNEKVKSTVDISDYFNTSSNYLSFARNGNKLYSVVVNGVINHDADSFENINIGDILTKNVVLMADICHGDYISKDLETEEVKDENGVISRKVKDGTVKDGTALDATQTTPAKRAEKFAEYAKKIFNSIASVFGYSPDNDLSGVGLNVDDASASALKFAYNMIINNYLNPLKLVNKGNQISENSMTQNSAYQNAVNYNAIGSNLYSNYCSLSLSNMLASFLTYYDNYLNGSNSLYAVGKSADTSVYVIDDMKYVYAAQDDSDAVKEVDQKTADFFDQIYNNIIEHGWREDSSINDNEYLESALKDGRYSMCSLNKDGYYYQTRYNETGYMVEVIDTDAIARAEAEFTSKKAELTYKEDSIDIKTKQLDAEISAITTEVDSVKNLISKSIEKTFQMFSN